LDKSNNINLDYLLPIMMKKSSEWAYEEEWKLIIIDNAEIGIEFPMPKPKAIYLGSEFNPENLKDIYTFCTTNKIDLYQMKLDSAEYKLLPSLLFNSNE